MTAWHHLLCINECNRTYLCAWTLTNFSTYFCCRLAGGELVFYVIPCSPKFNHHRVHLLCHVAGAVDNGESQSLRPQGRSHSLQLQCGGSVALHDLWGGSRRHLSVDESEEVVVGAVILACLPLISSSPALRFQRYTSGLLQSLDLI